MLRSSAAGLDLVGERGGLPIVRELLRGPKRFTDLRRRQLPPPAASWVYELTDGGPERAFGVWLHGATADVRHELPERPSATITTDTATLLAVLGDHDQLPAALTTSMAIDGDHRVVRQ